MTGLSLLRLFHINITISWQPEPRHHIRLHHLIQDRLQIIRKNEYQGSIYRFNNSNNINTNNDWRDFLLWRISIFE